MRALHIQCPNALLQSQQTLVDLRSLNPPLPIITLCVLCSLRAGEVHKQQLAQWLATGVPHVDLTYSVRPR